MSIKCSNCEFINPDIMRYCGGCGLRLLSTATDNLSEAQSSVERTNQFGALIGSDLLDRFKAAGLQATGQKRLVTILFVDLSGFTHMSEGIDPEELYEIVQQCSKIFANAVYKYDGMVDKFTGDGLMALFGAPIAHENNAELAIRAALDMQTELGKLSNTLRTQLGQELTAHIGLNSGSVIVGGIGSNMMMNYTAIGDVVNRASRIMNHAVSGEILVSERIYRQVRSLFDFVEMAPMTSKGVSQPVLTYKVTGVKNIAGASRVVDGLYSPMIGREGEFDRIQQIITQMVLEHNGRFISISGEAGIGKTRLISEITDQLNHLSIEIIEGQSFVYRKAVAYWVMQNLLLRCMDVDPDSKPEIISAKMLATIDSIFPENSRDILPYFEYMLSIPFSDSKKSQFLNYLPAEQLRTQIFRWLTELFVRRSVRSPLVIILEDLHWADNNSIDFLKYFIEHISKSSIVIITLSRAFDRTELSEINALASETLKLRYSHIQLQALSNDQVDQLLSQLSNISDFPDELKNEIVLRAAGIPLYVEEIIRMMKDQNIIFREKEHWKILEKANLNSLGNSDTLEGLILTRFDILDPITRHILKTASVTGRTFTSNLLLLCLPKLSTTEVTNSLEELIQKGFIQPDPSPGGEFQFKNLVISDTIYSTQLKKDRKEIHGLVGNAIETLFSDNLASKVDLLARHFYWSDFNSKALEYQIMAGSIAAKRYNTNQAKEYYENGLNLLSYTEHSIEQALAIYEGLGDVSIFQGNYVSAREAFENGLELCYSSQQSQPIMLAVLKRKIGFTFDKQGDLEAAMQYLAEAKDSLIGFDDPAELAQIASDQGWINLRRGHLEEAEGYLTQAEILSEGSNNLELKSSIFNRLGGFYYEKNNLSKANEYARKSMAIREEVGDIKGLARSYNNLALLEWKQNLWLKAYENFQKSVDIQKKLGDIENIIEINCNIAMLQLDRGQVMESINILNSAIKNAKEIGHSSYIALGTLYLGKSYLANEDWQLALESLTEAKVAFSFLDDPEYVMDLLFDLTLVYIHQDRCKEATETLNEATGLYDELEGDLQQNNKGRLNYVMGELSLLKKELNQAISYFELAKTAFLQNNNQLELAKTYAKFALAHQILGNKNLSMDYLESAKSIYIQLGAELDLQKLSKYFED